MVKVAGVLQIAVAKSVSTVLGVILMIAFQLTAVFICSGVS